MSGNQYKIGATLSYVSILLTNVIGLFVTPFIIKSLGDSEYGLYTFIGSFVAYLSLMDLGLNNAIIRFVAKYRAEKDSISEKKFLGTTLSIYGVISLFVLIIGGLLYFNLDSIFSKSLDFNQIEKAKTMFLILLLNIAIVLPGGSFTAICNAYEHFIFPRAMQIIKYLLRTLTVVAVLSAGGKAISIVAIDTVYNVLVITISIFYVLNKLKIKFDFSEKSWNAAKPIFNYSIWIFIGALVHLLQWNAGQIVLGLRQDTIQVAIFSIGSMLGSYYCIFAGSINVLLLPKANQMVVYGKSTDELNGMMVKVTNLTNFISFFILSGFFLVGSEFIHLWVGATYSQSWFVAMLMMVAITFPLSQNFGSCILEAKNKVRFVSLFNLSSILLGVIASFFVSPKYGITGITICIFISMMMSTVALNLYFKKIFDFRIGAFFRKTYLKQIGILGLLLCPLLFLVKKYFLIESWSRLILAIAIYTTLYLIVYYLFIFTLEERKFIRNLRSKKQAIKQNQQGIE